MTNSLEKERLVAYT